MLKQLPPETSLLAKTLYEQSEHFRSFVDRQHENRKEYIFDDREGRYTVSAVDPNEEFSAVSSATATTTSTENASSKTTTAPTVFKVKGKSSHVLLRFPHPRWFDCAREDFTDRKQKLQAGQATLLSSASVAVIAGVVLVLVFLRWPLWDCFVEIQANEHYRTLGVEPGATLSDVSKAYREAVRRLHPDKNPGCGQVCVTEMMKVKKAYEILKGKDEASELQQQIDGMMAQIVMFLFGEMLIFAIHTGVVLSGIIRYYVLGSLDYEINMDRPQPPRYLKKIVDNVDYATRVLLLLCSIGVVISTSDKNPLSIIAITYSVVTKWSDLRQSSEHYYRYRGLQVRDMLSSLLFYVAPAIVAHAVLPRLLGPLLAEASSLSLPAFLGFVDEFLTSDENTKSHPGWTLIVALIGVSHVVAAIYAAPPALGDNKVMMRCVVPDAATTVVAERADPSSGAAATAPDADGRVEIIQTRKATLRSVLTFFVTTVLLRDLLAFGLRVPAPYRLAALAVYGTSFVQMSQLPREASLWFDHRFRKAEDSAKRRAEMFRSGDENQKDSGADQESSNSSPPTSPITATSARSTATTMNNNDNNNNNNNRSSNNSSLLHRLLPLVDEGKFDFLNKDIPLEKQQLLQQQSSSSSASPPHVFRMNEMERSIISELDGEVPCWLELLRFDDFLTVRSHEIASESKFNNVLREIARRDLKIDMTRDRRGGRDGGGMVTLCPIFASLQHHQQQQHQHDGGSSGGGATKDAFLHYGAYRSSLVSKLMSHASEKFWDEEMSSYISMCFFWIFAATILLVLHTHTTASTSSSFSRDLLQQHNSNNHLSVRASNIFQPPDAAFAKVYDLNIQQQMGFSLNNCDEDPDAVEPTLLSNNNLQRSRSTKATLCRALLVPDSTSRQATTLIANMIFNTEGYDPRIIIQAGDYDDDEGEQKETDEEFKQRSQVTPQSSSSASSSESKSNSKKKQRRLSEKQKQQRSQHSLSLRQRKEEEKTSLKKSGESGGGGFFGDVPFFGEGSGGRFGGHDPANPSPEEWDDFMKFAQELERKQRERGYRPKAQFRAPGSSKSLNNNNKQINSKSRNKNNLRLGDGKKGGRPSKQKSDIDNNDDDEPWGKSGFSIDDDDDSGDGGHLIYGSSNPNQQQYQPSESQVVHLKNYQMKMMLKMQTWVDKEVAAGRLHLDWNGRIAEQDRSLLVEWMLENDETWEPDPNFRGTGGKNPRLGGPAAEELKRLRAEDKGGRNKKTNNRNR